MTIIAHSALISLVFYLISSNSDVSLKKNEKWLTDGRQVEMLTCKQVFVYSTCNVRIVDGGGLFGGFKIMPLIVKIQCVSICYHSLIVLHIENSIAGTRIIWSDRWRSKGGCCRR